MTISQIQLEAFTEVSKAKSFSKAADALGLTQSALSHRIRNLEEHLQISLFIRRGHGIELTEAGTKLIRYCRLQRQAEEEFIQEFLPKKNTAGKLSGTIRLGGASTLIRSVVVPALAQLLNDNHDIRIQLHTAELRDLPSLLNRGEVDFLVTCEGVQIPGSVERIIGYEENVLIESNRKKRAADVYLDHDMEDKTTFNFLKFNGKKSSVLNRSFMDDIYGIIDGVSHGLGKAVVPTHLIAGRKDLSIVKDYKSVKTPVCLYQMDQPYYSKLHLAVSENLERNAKIFLHSKT